MGTASTVIVAIPSVDDHVWKVSSEKVPHLTMLYLGENVSAEDQAQIALFLQHVAEVSLYRFGLQVDKRGKLGPQDADVLFFETGWSTKEIAENRGFLLQNDLIKKAYELAPQFEGWVPHLTLGFPDTPANEDERDYPISYVRFDKIALWTGDYDGPEFELEDRYSDLTEAAWGDIGSLLVKDLHHKEAVSEKPWSDYKKSDYSVEQWHAACLLHQHEGAAESKSECKLPVRTPSGTLNKNGVVAAAAALAGARGGVNATDDEKKKAKASLARLYSQLEMDLPDSLKHYGIKGMRWGVRKSESEGGTSAKRSKVPPKPSEDKKSALESAAKVQKGDTSALSNKELQALVQRMNLEQQYSRLSSQPGKVEAGTKKAKAILDTANTGKTAYNLIAPTPLGKRIGKLLRRGVISAAVLAGKAYYKRK